MAQRKPRQVGVGESSDAPENALHPRKTLVLYGQAKAEGSFLNAFKAGTLHHAWLLTGERGIGKATFAYRAARFLIGQGEVAHNAASEAQTLAMSAEHPVTRQIAAGAHPSLFVLGSDGSGAGETGTISVDAARKLKGFLALTSTSGWRAITGFPVSLESRCAR